MTLVNPALHGHGLFFAPVNRVTAVLSSQRGTRSALRELHGAGFGDDSVELFAGPAGAAALDLTGERHGIVARVIKTIEANADPEIGDSMRAADAELKAGGYVVAVRMDGHEHQRRQVAEILAAHGGRFIRYWTRWFVESLG